MTGSQWLGVILVVLFMAAAGVALALLSGGFAAVGLLALGALLIAGAVTL